LGNKNIEHESVVIDKNIWIANTQGNLSLPQTQLPKCLQSKAPNFRQLCQKIVSQGFFVLLFAIILMNQV